MPISNSPTTDASAPAYRAGVAARLAGIPVETLRVWERRYRVVGPRMSAGGQRLYSLEDVQRLALIKQVVDMGHPIGAIAGLAADALVAMRDAARTLITRPAANEGAGPLRVAFIGPMLAARRRDAHLLGEGLTLAGVCGNAADAGTELRGLGVDVAVVELSTLNDRSAGFLQALRSDVGAARVLVLYRFGPSAVIRQLRSAGHAVARTPADLQEIVPLLTGVHRVAAPPQVVAAAAPANQAAEPPAIRLDEGALTQLAGASNAVYCECPRHLVDLLLSLGSFERYSAECANRGPEDAALHRDLQSAAAHARSLLEAALIRVAVAEGLPLPTAHTGAGIAA